MIVGGGHWNAVGICWESPAVASHWKMLLEVFDAGEEGQWIKEGENSKASYGNKKLFYFKSMVGEPQWDGS